MLERLDMVHICKNSTNRIIMSYNRLDKVNKFRKLNRRILMKDIQQHDGSDKITNIKIRPQQGITMRNLLKHLC
jgi:hypothetical protein